MALRKTAVSWSSTRACMQGPVLTRLPPPVRRTPASARQLITANFPHSRHLGQAAAAASLTDLPGAGVAGGSVHDALAGAVAKEHGITLCTRDQRAVETYRALDIDYDLLVDASRHDDDHS